MKGDDERRRELGDFLRKRREQLVRADFELPPVGRRRLTGLRREEVAYRSGVSVTWYTWLEQGRDINPSRQVIDSVANNMRLSQAEQHYVLALAGYAPNDTAAPTPAAPAPAHIQRLLAVQGDSPSFAVSPDWGIAAWNRAYEALYPNVATVPDQERNLLLLIFTDPYVRRMLPDWAVTSRHFVAEYRAQAGPLLGHPAHAALVARLRAASPEFEQVWLEHKIERFASRERRFHHPDVGDLTFEHHRLIPSDLPDIHIVIYIAHDADSKEKMAKLISNAGI